MSIRTFEKTFVGLGCATPAHQCNLADRSFNQYVWLPAQQHRSALWEKVKAMNLGTCRKNCGPIWNSVPHSRLPGFRPRPTEA